MLTDIFANRYSERPIWDSIRESDRVLLVQCFRNISEQVMPFRQDGKVDEESKKLWDSVERRLGMELGLLELSPHTYGYYNASKVWISGTWTLDKVCKDWYFAKLPEGTSPDRYIKERISFVELAFRQRDYAISMHLAAIKFLGQNSLHRDTITQSAQRENKQRRDLFNGFCDELNERFRQARVPLTYNNGYVQIAADEKTEEQVARPFWKIAGAAKWANVSTDMAEAVDRRDTKRRDPAFYAAKALESAIRIISDDLGRSRGSEKGASDYVNNLVAEKDGARFIEVWEKELLITYFGKVRNPFGHGPGASPMPVLSDSQTDWAIENAMSWCKSLINRLKP